MIRIVGDVCFSDRYSDIGLGIGSKLKNNYDPFENLDFGPDTIWLGNLECVISDSSTLTGFESRRFRIPFNHISSLNHLDIYSVANNHVMQHGDDAYNQMLNNISKLGSKYVGNLMNKSITFHHKDHTFGLVVFSQRAEVFSKKPLYWLRPECIEIEFELRKINSCDFKIVYMHWGNEFINYPHVEQKKFAHWLIDIGFDLVVGTHSHVLQGYEIYKTKYIFYSLGNFLYNMPIVDARYSAVVNLDVMAGELVVTYDYIYIDKENKCNIVAPKNVPKKYLFETLNEKINIEADNEIYYQNVFLKRSFYKKKNRLWILSTIHKHNLKEILFLVKDFVSR